MNDNEIAVSEEIRETFPNDWPEWVLLGLDKLSENELPEAEEYFEGAPPEIENIYQEEQLKRIATAKSVARKKDGPGFLGAMAGSFQKMIEAPEAIEQRKEFYRIIERIEAVDFTTIPTPSNRELLQEMRSLPPDDPQRDAINEILQMTKDRVAELGELMPALARARDILLYQLRPIADEAVKIMEQKKSAVQHCLKMALELDDFEQKTAFMEAYNKALQETKIVDFEHMAPNEKMFSMISMAWTEVAEFNNRAELRDWLVLMLGKPSVYNPSMVNKNCQRKNLLRKEPEKSQG